MTTYVNDFGTQRVPPVTVDDLWCRRRVPDYRPPFWKGPLWSPVVAVERPLLGDVASCHFVLVPWLFFARDLSPDCWAWSAGAAEILQASAEGQLFGCLDYRAPSAWVPVDNSANGAYAYDYEQVTGSRLPIILRRGLP